MTSVFGCCILVSGWASCVLVALRREWWSEADACGRVRRTVWAARTANQPASLTSSSESTLTIIRFSPVQNSPNKTRPTLKSSHQQLSSRLALSSHMLNEFILPALPVVQNSDVNSYAMGLVATQRPKTKCLHLGRLCEWLCFLLLVEDQRPPFVGTAILAIPLCCKCVLFYMRSKRFKYGRCRFDSRHGLLPVRRVDQSSNQDFKALLKGQLVWRFSLHSDSFYGEILTCHMW